MERTIQYSLKLVNLHCYISDEGDADEVFLKMDGKKIWPKKGKYVSMKDKSAPIDIEFKVDKGSSFDIEVWDYDFWSPNDLLGIIKIDASQAGGPFTSAMEKKEKGDAKYALEYEVL